MPIDVNSPLIALYILDSSGIPLFARHYEGTLSEHEAVLLGGFFSAIEVFARSTLKSSLVDIGVEDKRFYFNNILDRYIQIVVGGQDLPNSELKTIKLVQKKIELALAIVTDISEHNNLDANQVVKGLGESFDSMVMESILENIDETLEIGTVNLKGKSIDYSDFNFDFNEILDKLNSFLN